MQAEAILNLISDEALDFMAAETKADYKVSKLKGRVLFKLLVYSLVTSRQASLRVLEAVFNSYAFKMACGITPNEQTRHSSIRDRIATIPPLYFKKLFEHCVSVYSPILGAEGQRLLRFDSTMVAVSTALLDFGIKAGEKTDKKQVKFTVGFDGLLPCTAKAFTQKQYTSENKALAEVIGEASLRRDDICVFDRGLQSRTTLGSFSEKGTYFVTRLKTDARFEVIGSRAVQQPGPSDSVSIQSDQQVYLFDHSGKTTGSFRLIQATIIKTVQPIWFLTNLVDLDGCQIAALYKKRWDIEVFFRFIKQELGFDHVMVRTKEGVEVMLYVTLITAMLLLAYRKTNNLKGYKLPKLHFAQELEEELIKQVVLICGGDPSKMYHAP